MKKSDNESKKSFLRKVTKYKTIFLLESVQLTIQMSSIDRSIEQSLMMSKTDYFFLTKYRAYKEEVLD